jgi:uncharacterized protein with HEPN domain
MSDKDKGNLMAIVESCSKIGAFASDTTDADNFYNDVKTFDAAMMNFIIIGESVARLSDDLKAANNDIPWQKIKFFRNIVAHDYFGINAEEVWSLVKQRIPELKEQVQLILLSA